MRYARFALAVLALAAASAAAQDRAPREVEVTVAVPRDRNGELDPAALNAEVRRRFAAGATEIHFRVDSLSQDEARRLLLVSDRNLLVDIGSRLPNDGVERTVRFRGEVDARVQRTEEGELRARIEHINLGRLSAAERAALAREIADSGNLDRLRIRGVDANGERVRIEFRDGRGIVRNEGRAERVARSDNSGSGRAERVERNPRVERAERAERPERVERSGGGNSGRH